ncbi:MAG: AAA family ATPase [Oscillospiraceae bacterium]|nr:AAA family ATPase [Oscillospiraceae bacterium]
MYTYLKLKNFRTFDDICIDFKKTEKDINKFIAIYGENGSGKTSIVLAFNLLKDALMSLIYENLISENINKLPNLPNNIALMQIKNAIQSMDFNKTAGNVKMLNSSESTEVEYGFSIGGVEGYYKIKFGNVLESETLYYLTNKNRGNIFEIMRDENGIVKNINDSMFSDEIYKNEISVEIDKFWGKHTLLSILIKELNTKNVKFIEDRISNNLSQVINELLNQTVVYVAMPDGTIGKSANINKNLYLNLNAGIIPINMEKQLNVSEKVLRNFFVQAYPDIKDVFYKKNTIIESNLINYELYFKKNICGKLVDVIFSQESTGTQKLVNIFNSLMGVLFGGTVIIDEIDNGIHDILMKTIIESIKENITGQLIITTHNTLLLESLDKHEIYIITTDYNGKKEINPISNYDMKIQKNNNIRDLYLKGVFGGVPFIDYIDFNEIKQDLETTGQ